MIYSILVICFLSTNVYGGYPTYGRNIPESIVHSYDSGQNAPHPPTITLDALIFQDKSKESEDHSIIDAIINDAANTVKDNIMTLLVPESLDGTSTNVGKMNINSVIGTQFGSANDNGQYKIKLPSQSNLHIDVGLKEYKDTFIQNNGAVREFQMTPNLSKSISGTAVIQPIVPNKNSVNTIVKNDMIQENQAGSAAGIGEISEENFNGQASVAIDNHGIMMETDPIPFSTFQENYPGNVLNSAQIPKQIPQKFGINISGEIFKNGNSGYPKNINPEFLNPQFLQDGKSVSATMGISGSQETLPLNGVISKIFNQQENSESQNDKSIDAPIGINDGNYQNPGIYQNQQGNSNSFHSQPIGPQFSNVDFSHSGEKRVSASIGINAEIMPLGGVLSQNPSVNLQDVNMGSLIASDQNQRITSQATNGIQTANYNQNGIVQNSRIDGKELSGSETLFGGSIFGHIPLDNNQNVHATILQPFNGIPSTHTNGGFTNSQFTNPTVISSGTKHELPINNAPLLGATFGTGLVNSEKNNPNLNSGNKQIVNDEHGQFIGSQINEGFLRSDEHFNSKVGGKSLGISGGIFSDGVNLSAGTNGGGMSIGIGGIIPNTGNISLGAGSMHADVGEVFVNSEGFTYGDISHKPQEISIGAGVMSPSTEAISSGAGAILLDAGVISPDAGAVPLSAGPISPGTGAISLAAEDIPLGAGAISSGTGSLSFSGEVISPGTRTLPTGVRTTSPGVRTTSPGVRTTSPGAGAILPGFETVSPGTENISLRDKDISIDAGVIFPGAGSINSGVEGIASSAGDLFHDAGRITPGTESLIPGMGMMNVATGGVISGMGNKTPSTDNITPDIGGKSSGNASIIPGAVIIASDITGIVPGTGGKVPDIKTSNQGHSSNEGLNFGLTTSGNAYGNSARSKPGKIFDEHEHKHFGGGYGHDHGYDYHHHHHHYPYHKYEHHNHGSDYEYDFDYDEPHHGYHQKHKSYHHHGY